MLARVTIYDSQHGGATCSRSPGTIRVGIPAGQGARGAARNGRLAGPRVWRAAGDALRLASSFHTVGAAEYRPGGRGARGSLRAGGQKQLVVYSCLLRCRWIWCPGKSGARRSWREPLRTGRFSMPPELCPEIRACPAIGQSSRHLRIVGQSRRRRDMA